MAPSAQWLDYTFSPWIGCTKVSTGCLHCLTDEWNRKTGRARWGVGLPRDPRPDGAWASPVQWNAVATSQKRVFAGPLGDVFDSAGLSEERARFWALVKATPKLDWFVLTKRPENIIAMLPPDWGEGYANVWLGVSVENQEMFDLRAPLVRAVPAQHRFLMFEPLLGPLAVEGHLDGFVWALIGPETGPQARPVDVAWGLSLATACKAAGLGVFCKCNDSAPAGMPHDLPERA
jgi:protein gp37